MLDNRDNKPQTLTFPITLVANQTESAISELSNHKMGNLVEVIYDLLFRGRGSRILLLSKVTTVLTVTET